LQITFKTSAMILEDLPLDVGYASEEVSLKDVHGNQHTLGGQNGKTQLIITAAFLDEAFLQELSEIDKSLPKGGAHEVTAALVVAHDGHKNPNLQNIDFLIDANQELGDFYGTRLKGEPYHHELTKALILVSKDGAIFYDEFVRELNNKFNIETLARKIMAAQVCYTGQGCHS